MPENLMLENFIRKLTDAPQDIQFKEVIDLIDALYRFEATAFKNGDVRNEAGQNSGSCKIFAFARRQNLSAQQTLECFGNYYRDDVLRHPEGADHQNIRNFIKTGWSGVEFFGEPLLDR